MSGGNGDDFMIGDAISGYYNGRVVTGSGDDVMDGGEGDDFMIGDAQNGGIANQAVGTGNDTMFGGGGDDFLFGDVTRNYNYSSGYGNDSLSGGDGDDFLLGDGGYGDGGRDTLLGDAGNDTLFGDAGNEYYGSSNNSLIGGDGNDELFGEGGNDTLRASTGMDTLDGGTGVDSLRGAQDADVFLFDNVDGLFGDDGPNSGVGLGLRDIIDDFQGAGVAGGDVIALGDINNNSQNLQFDADNKFDSEGDIIRASNGKGGCVLQIHTDGNGSVDMEIELLGVAPTALTANDFSLELPS